MAATQTSSKRRTRSSTSSNGSAPQALADAAQRATGPALAGGAAVAGAVAGLAAGTVLGSKLRARRRPQLLGLPLPRGSELKSGAKQAARAGRWAAEMRSDVRAVRAQAAESRHHSPIEVLLSGLTSRRIPRRDASG